MATNNVFAEFEVAANREAPGRRLRTADARDRTAALNLWNGLSLAQQITLQLALTNFNAALRRVENLEAALPKIDADSEDNNEIADFLQELQSLVTGRTACIGAIDRLIQPRRARINADPALAYLRRLRAEQAGFLQADQIRHANFTTRLAAPAFQPAAAADDDAQAPLEDEEPAAPPGNLDDQPGAGSTSSSEQSDDGGSAGNASPDLILSPTAPYEDADEQRRNQGRLNDRWVPVMQLDPGSTGVPQVWAKRNSHNMIIDRLAMKHCATFSADERPSLWDGDKPVEAIAMLRLKSRQGGDRVVKLRNWRLGNASYLNVRGNWMQNCLFYLEYCGFGDLYNLYRVHLTRNTTHYPEIGDFGAACLLQKNDRRSWAERSDDALGTPANKAPEQIYPILFGDPGVTHALTTKTNVWAIGNLMWSLVTLNGEGDNLLEDGFTEEHKVPSAFTDEVKTVYSSTLLDLIMTLVPYLPHQRASLDSVLASIRKATRPGNNDLANGLRTAPKDDPGFTTHAPLLIADRYALWSAFPDAPPAAPQSRKRNADEAFNNGREDAGSVSSDSDDDLGGDAGTMIHPGALVDHLAVVDARVAADEQAETNRQAELNRQLQLAGQGLLPPQA